MNLQISLIDPAPLHEDNTVNWLNSEDIRKTFGITSYVSRCSHRNWLESRPDLIRKSILVDSVHVGNIILHPNYRHKSGILEIYIGDSDARGVGVGYNALVIFLDDIFEKKRFHRVSLVTREDNTIASSLYSKLGFVREGAERESIMTFDNVWVNQVRWSLLSSEWLARY